MDTFCMLICGWTTSLAVTGSGQVWEWGWEKNIFNMVKVAARYQGSKLAGLLEWLQSFNLGWLTYNRAVTSPALVDSFVCLESDQIDRYKLILIMM